MEAGTGGPPPPLHSLLRAEPAHRLHLPGWQCHLRFLGRPSWSPVVSVQRLPARLTVSHVLPPTAEPRIRVNGSRDADEPLRVTAKAGDEVTLDCEARGSPAPLVTWTKDLRPVPPTTDR